ncbi:LOW QUALITY PROTEIN: hypothetical protein Cgig2_028984 [Carnegiea gigantea]|uniref:Cation-transporting P-type ATPase N-terminal domain-containing protein n=1 Tax=Carnegiea gigantea TaxID=171969 RepID=A0A9Q1JVG4_9CARY|nr:LOW QUALITY PROTEIN: hypothetical protein Cgig2_028984 [Carnegiea gigantea]
MIFHPPVKLPLLRLFSPFKSFKSYGISFFFKAPSPSRSVKHPLLPLCALKSSVLAPSSFPTLLRSLLPKEMQEPGLDNCLILVFVYTSFEQERVPLEEVFGELRTSRDGLTTVDAEARLTIFGPNKLEEKPENKFLKFLSFMWNPLSWVMEAAAVMALVLANGGIVSKICVINGNFPDHLLQGEGPDWQDFVGIMCLLLINSTISFIEENNAGNAAAALMARLAPKTKFLALTGESWACYKEDGCFKKELDKDTIVLILPPGPSRLKTKILTMPSSTCLAIRRRHVQTSHEVHFMPFNPLLTKRTAITYMLMENGTGPPKEAPEQEVPERSKESPGGPWTFCGLLPLFDPPRHDSAETIRRALNLGVCVKMITGDQLAIAKETGRRLGMGTNMYPSSSLLGREKDENEALPVDELIEKADGFAGVFPEHKYEIVKILQEKKHIVGMTGDGVNDAPALKKADIGIAVADATDAARSAADLVLTEPGLSVIISAVLTSRAIFQRMKNYTIYAVSITIRIVLGFMLLALIWEYDFPPFMVLIIAILNDGTIMTISKDRVKPSPVPDSWKLNEIFATGIVIGTYLALVTVLFYWVANDTSFFEDHFGVSSLAGDTKKISSAVYLQVSIISQALIFVTRSQSWSFLERPGVLLMCAFVVAQLVATLIAVYAKIDFASISGIGWGWAGVIWLYSLIFYFPLDIVKFVVRYALSGEAWNLLFDTKTAFSSKKDYMEERTARWASSQKSLRRLQSMEFEGEGRPGKGYSLIAEQAKRRAEIARLREIYTLNGHVESVMRLKNLDLLVPSSHTI